MENLEAREPIKISNITMWQITCRGDLPVRRKFLPGDWISMYYGFERKMFYVLKYNHQTGIIVIGSPKWCVSDSVTMEIEELLSRKAKYVCSTRRNILRYIFFPLRDLICPFYKPFST